MPIILGSIKILDLILYILLFRIWSSYVNKTPEIMNVTLQDLLKTFLVLEMLLYCQESRWLAKIYLKLNILILTLKFLHSANTHLFLPPTSYLNCHILLHFNKLNFYTTSAQAKILVLSLFAFFYYIPSSDPSENLLGSIFKIYLVFSCFSLHLT